MPPREIRIAANLYVQKPREKSTLGDRNGENCGAEGGGGERQGLAQDLQYIVLAGQKCL